MTQLLALAAAQRLGVAGVRTFSGGTEATAFNPRAIAALSRLGFELSSGEGKNPKVAVRFSPVAEPVEAFSKKYTDPPNPEKDFVVVMTCSQADGSCPFVVGALSRVAIPYEDPKVADGTPEEAARYDERARDWRPDLHLVLWNPYQALDVDAPALLSYGYAGGALAAVRDWLRGAAPAPGRALQSLQGGRP